MKTCPRCGFLNDIQTDECTRCGFRINPSADGTSSDEGEYVPGIVAAARKELEEAKAQEASATDPELSYPMVDRRKRPRNDVGKRESKVYDTKQGDKFYYDYMDPNYVPPLLATAPPPPPPMEKAGLRSPFRPATEVKPSENPEEPEKNGSEKKDEQVPIWMRSKLPDFPEE